MSAVSACKSAARNLCLLATLIVCPAIPAQTPGGSAPPPLAAADAAMQAGRFADAAREYEAWLKIHPDSTGVLLALGICYVQLGRPGEAIAPLRRHVKLTPRSAAGHAALGIALLDGAKTAEAKTELETAVRLNPGQTDAVEALARIHLIEGEAERAVRLLRPLVEADGATDETRAMLGDALVRAGQAREAGQLLEREIQANSGRRRGRSSTPRLYTMAAWAYLKAGEAAKAAEICEQGMRLFPDSEIESVYLSLPAPFLAQRIGARIEQLQTRPDAAELIAVARVLIDADAANKTRANEIAGRLLEHAIALAPDNASAHYNYGRALSRSSTERALGEWEKALTLNPGGELRLQILMKIGAAKLNLSDYEAAERAYRAALEINRTLPRRNPDAVLEYVRFLQLKSRPAEAEALLDEVLSLSPLSPQARLERAKLLVIRGQWEKVIEEGEFVLRHAGEDMELLRAAHTLLARAYLRLNRPEAAQKHRTWIESH